MTYNSILTTRSKVTRRIHIEDKPQKSISKRWESIKTTIIVFSRTTLYRKKNLFRNGSPQNMRIFWHFSWGQTIK